MTQTLILHCSCVSAFQDETYGDGNRVHNRKVKPDSNHWRCTVCGTVRFATVPSDT